jgi:hypothetical protein
VDRFSLAEVALVFIAPTDYDPDSKDAKINDNNDVADLSEIKFKKFDLATLPSDWSLKLTLKKPDGDTYSVAAGARVRVFEKKEEGNDKVLLGLQADGTVKTTATFTVGGTGDNFDLNTLKGTGQATWGIEGLEHGCEVVIKAELLKGTTAMGSDEIRILVCPFLMIPQTKTVSSTSPKVMYSHWANYTYWNSDISSAIGSMLMSTPTSFIQDYGEFGYQDKRTANSSGTVMKVILKLNGERLNSTKKVLAKEISSNLGFYEIPTTVVPSYSSLDDGGAVECLPPVGDDRFGRVVLSKTDSTSAGIKPFFDHQKAQPVVEVNVGGYAVHADEVISVVKGGVILVADIELAIGLVDGAITGGKRDSSWAYPATHRPLWNFDTYGDVSEYYKNGTGLTFFNSTKQKLNAIASSMTEYTVKRVPVLYTGLFPTAYGDVNAINSAPINSIILIPNIWVPEFMADFKSKLNSIGYGDTDIKEMRVSGWGRITPAFQGGAVHCLTLVNRSN